MKRSLVVFLLASFATTLSLDVAEALRSSSYDHFFKYLVAIGASGLFYVTYGRMRG
jgi:hypothetical protein